MTLNLSLLSLLWRKVLWRHWLRSPGATLTLILTLSLGVGVFFSIRLANRAAVSGFQIFTRNLMGKNDLILSAPSGRLNTSILPDLRKATGDLPVSFFPVLETTATIPEGDEATDGFWGTQMQIVGLDIPTLANLIYLADSDYQPPGFQQTATANLQGIKHRIYVSPVLARERNWQAGTIIKLLFNTTLSEVLITGILPEESLQVQTPAHLAIMEISSVQELAGLTEQMDRIEIRIPPGHYHDEWLTETKAALKKNASDRWVVSLPEKLNRSGDTMTKAFRLNLTVLSCLALIVGMYLIVQALEASVVKRRTEIGTLRSLGITSTQIRIAWQIEALMLGLIGTGLGLLIGFGGAQLAVRGIASTVNALYFSNTVEAASWNNGEALLAFTLGLGTSLIAGWLPARDAALTSPAQVLQHGTRKPSRSHFQHPITGIVLLIIGAFLTRTPPMALEGKTWFPLGGYLAALCLLLGASVIGGNCFSLLTWLKQFNKRGRPSWTFALSQLKRPTGRHRLAVAGLLTAFSMTCGMSILLASFETTMQSWIHRALRADLYIAPKGIGNVSSQNRIEPSVWKAIAEDPAAANAEIGQVYKIALGEAQTYLVGAEGRNQSGWENLIWIEEPTYELSKQESETIYAWANESFTSRFQFQTGDQILVPTPSGTKALILSGIYADYGNEQGSLLVDRRLLEDWFQDSRALNVALYLNEDVSAIETRDRIASNHPGLVVRLNQELRDEVLRIFHQTFSVTHALKWIGVIVAVIGMALALVSLCIERRRELATLRELGMDRRAIANTLALEGALITTLANVIGAILSVALGWLLIYIINKQSFGWTLAFQIPWMEMFLSSLAILVVASLTSWRIGWWAARLPADREE